MTIVSSSWFKNSDQRHRINRWRHKDGMGHSFALLKKQSTCLVSTTRVTNGVGANRERQGKSDHVDVHSRSFSKMLAARAR